MDTWTPLSFTRAVRTAAGGVAPPGTSKAARDRRT